MSEFRRIIECILLLKSDNFSDLIKAANLNTESDLRFCDFTDTDFGALEGRTLNLEGCNLTNTNLAAVKFNKIIYKNAHFEGTVFPTAHNPTRPQTPPPTKNSEHEKYIIDIVNFISRLVPSVDIPKELDRLSKKYDKIYITYNSASEMNNISKILLEYIKKAKQSGLPHIERNFNALFLRLRNTEKRNNKYAKEESSIKRFVDAIRHSELMYQTEELKRRGNVNLIFEKSYNYDQSITKICNIISSGPHSIVIFVGISPIPVELFLRIPPERRVSFIVAMHEDDFLRSNYWGRAALSNSIYLNREATLSAIDAGSILSEINHLRSKGMEVPRSFDGFVLRQIGVGISHAKRKIIQKLMEV